MEKGDRFSKLTFLEKSKDRISFSGRKYKFGKFICDCGKLKEINLQSVKRKLTLSCGCHHKKICKEVNTKHGQSKSGNFHSEYRSWEQMKDRCLNPKNIAYHNYGGRGIKVCDRWLESFENFIEDLGQKPEKYYSLDRVDVDGNYSPENCRWTNNNVQSYNRRLLESNTSGKTGVCWHRTVGAWHVQFYVDGENKSFGYFEYLIDAIFKRMEIEQQFYGEVKQ